MKRGWVIAIIVGAVLVVAGVVFMSITRWGWAWTGVVGHAVPKDAENQEFVPGKTLWDLLELLIVPVALAVTALLFSNKERHEDREAAEKRAKNDWEMATDRIQESSLQIYFDKMTELILNNEFGSNEENLTTLSIARARTITTLRTLDNKRKSILVRFLYEANLLGRTDSLSYLLQGADISGADLSNIDLSFCSLRETNLSNTILRYVSFDHANLMAAKLAGANIKEANFNRADLAGADLSGVKGYTYEQLAHASHLNLAIMPDGKRYDPNTHIDLAKKNTSREYSTESKI